jgi:hypothetical protein
LYRHGGSSLPERRHGSGAHIANGGVGFASRPAGYNQRLFTKIRNTRTP